MKFNSRRELLLNVYFTLFSLCLVYKFISTIFDKSRLYYDWNITEWLINYQGGFVRRGLRGEIIYQLYNKFGWDVYIVISTITIAAFCVLSFFFIKGFIKKKLPLLILPFAIFLGNPILNNFWMRTDSVILLIFIAVVFVIKKELRYDILVVNILLSIGLLIHEIFIFIAFPITFLFFLKKYNGKKYTFFKIILSLSPSLLIFFITSYFKGNQNTALLIKKSWEHIPLPKELVASISQNYWGAVDGIGFSLSQGLAMPFNFFRCFDFQFGIYGPLPLVLTVVTTYIILNNINQLDNKIWRYTPTPINTTVLSSTLFFQFCSISPLYLIGFDYARWIYLWVCSSFILLIIMPNNKTDHIFPEKIKNISININSFVVSLIGNSKTMLLCLLFFIGIPTYLWSLAIAVESSSVFILIKYMSFLIQKILLAFGMQLINYLDL